MSEDRSGWTEVAVLTDRQEAELLVGMLRNAGLDAEIESRYFTQEPVALGVLGDVRIFVPDDQVAEARALIDEAAAGLPGDSNETA